MNCKIVSEYIIKWLKLKIIETSLEGFVIGVSGGVDSAVTSTLCAKTDLPTICLIMPINQLSNQYNLSLKHVKWLRNNYKNVRYYVINLNNVFHELRSSLPNEAKQEISMVNCKSRIMMVTLYTFSNSNKYYVVGTGNKVEDFGVGFFTKYGDGGVDLSPIGDLVKSEVYQLAKYLGISEEIINAPPTDGLWDMDRTDEEHIGATYDELEWAMKYCSNNNIESENDIKNMKTLTQRQIEVLEIYMLNHLSQRHKMMMPPICKLTNIKKGNRQ